MFESNDTFVEEAVKVIESPQDRAKKTGALIATMIFNSYYVDFAHCHGYFYDNLIHE